MRNLPLRQNRIFTSCFFPFFQRSSFPVRGKNVVVSAIYHINGSSHQKTSLRFILPEMARRDVLIFSGEISSLRTFFALQRSVFRYPFPAARQRALSERVRGARAMYSGRFGRPRGNRIGRFRVRSADSINRRAFC